MLWQSGLVRTTLSRHIGNLLGWNLLNVRFLSEPCSSQGTIRISYSYINRGESDLQLNVTDTFHARQIVYPVKVTVYHTLQFSNLDVIPLYSAPFTSRASSHNLTKSFSDVQPDTGEYCLVSVDVSNIYGLPFSVTLERHQEGTFSEQGLDFV